MKKRRIRNIALFALAVIVCLSITVVKFVANSDIKAAETLPETTDVGSSLTVKSVALASVTPVASTQDVTEPEPEKLESLGEFVITAYCPCVQCCGEWSAEHPSRVGTDYIQKTASGTIPTAGRTIGVDPSVIPFGTIVVINGHEYVAEDRGGAINGNKIDIFFNSHEGALEFGRQMAEIFIKNKED